MLINKENLPQLSLSLLQSFEVLRVRQFVRLLLLVQINEVQLRKLPQLVHYFLVVVLVNCYLVQFDVFRSLRQVIQKNTYRKMPISIFYIKINYLEIFYLP